MKCPHCGADNSRVTDTRSPRRIHLCRSCGKNFNTIELVTEWMGRERGWVTEPPPPGDEGADLPRHAPPPKARPARLSRFTAEQVPQFLGFSAEVSDLLLTWWNESRRSRHQGRAVWTERAWLGSLGRVAELPPEQQLQLCQAAVENGWQGIYAHYLPGGIRQGAAAEPPHGRHGLGVGPAPRDPRMVAALEEEGRVPWD